MNAPTLPIEEQVAHLSVQLQESQDNTAVVLKTTQSLEHATCFDDAARGALECVRSCFGWAYGSYWSFDPSGGCAIVCESGTVDPEFDHLARQTRYSPMTGLAGRVSRERELVSIDNLTAAEDVRLASAMRHGMRTCVMFPIIVNDEVVGVMDFFADQPLTPLSAERLDSLHSVSMLLSLCFTRLQNLKQASRLLAAISGASNALMLCSTDFEVAYTNPAVEQLFRRNESAFRSCSSEFSVDRLLGSSIGIFFPDPTVPQRIFSNVNALPALHQIEIADRIFEINVTAILDHQGHWMGNCLEWRDLTEQRHAEEQVAGLIRSAVAGDIDHRIDASNFDGFMKGLAEGFNQLMDTVSDPIRQTAEIVSSLARGRLVETLHGGFEGEFGGLEESVNSCVLNLREMVENVKRVAANMQEASANIAQGNTDLSQRTEEQAASLEQTASTMEEITGAVRQNADNAKRADELALEAKVSAEKGGQVVGNAVGAMGEINASSRKIEDIIGVIDEIAFQTNLLALNAAVEAARAGEQGRGFAVVANEVRSLAQRSAGAAKEIKALIKDSVCKVEEGTRLVDASGQTLSEIFQSVEIVSDIIGDIASASGEQTRGIEQINRAIAHLDEMTQQNAALVEQAAAAAESLDEQTANLNDMMTFFDVGEQRSQPQRRPSRKTARVQRRHVAPEDEWEEF